MIDSHRKYNFDGLDLDWEFPAQRGGAPNDKENFVALVKVRISLLFLSSLRLQSGAHIVTTKCDVDRFPSQDLSGAFKSKGLLLTAALGAGIETMKVAYDIHQLSTYLDYIHVMAYDYHGAWNQRVLPNAPLHHAPDSLTAVSRHRDNPRSWIAFRIIQSLNSKIAFHWQ